MILASLSAASWRADRQSRAAAVAIKAAVEGVLILQPATESALTTAEDLFSKGTDGP